MLCQMSWLGIRGSCNRISRDPTSSARRRLLRPYLRTWTTVDLECGIRADDRPWRSRRACMHAASRRGRSCACRDEEWPSHSPRCHGKCWTLWSRFRAPKSHRRIVWLLSSKHPNGIPLEIQLATIAPFICDKTIETLKYLCGNYKTVDETRGTVTPLDKTITITTHRRRDIPAGETNVKKEIKARADVVFQNTWFQIVLYLECENLKE